MVWEALRKALAPCARAELCARTGVAPSTVANYLQGLVAAGIVEKEDTERGPFYRLVRDSGHHAPRVRRDGSIVRNGDGNANIWRSMRMLKQFSAADLLLHSTTPDVQISDSHVRVYCLRLFEAGYLKVVQKASPPKRAAVYRLIRDTGPRPPKVQRVQQVFDPNTGTVYPAEGRA